MHKKSITLRLDAVSKTILLILGAGVWLMALRPLGVSTVHAQDKDREMAGVEKQLVKMNGWLEKIWRTMPM